MKAIIFGSIGTLVETSDIQRQSFNQAFKEIGLDWYWDKNNYKNLLKNFDLQKFLIRRQGILIDRTDNRVDPRNGIRLQYERWDSEGIGITDTVVNDYSLTLYIPFVSKSNILVGNLFHSSSYVTSPLETTLEFDYEKCLERYSNSKNLLSSISAETLSLIHI